MAYNELEISNSLFSHDSLAHVTTRSIGIILSLWNFTPFLFP